MMQPDRDTVIAFGEMLDVLKEEGTPHNLFWINHKIGGFLIPREDMYQELNMSEEEKEMNAEIAAAVKKVAEEIHARSENG